jgi:AcrR family transcriptional regulator
MSDSDKDDAAKDRHDDEVIDLRDGAIPSHTAVGREGRGGALVGSPGADRPEGPSSQPADRQQAGAGRTRRGLNAAERRRERRLALLAAALDLIGTKGYASTSVEEICRTAYVSTRNFYEEFDNREALLWALYDQVIVRAYQAMLRADDEHGADHLRGEVRARTGALVHTFLDDPRWARLVFVETLGVSVEQEARRRATHLLFARYFVSVLGSASSDAGSSSEDGFANRHQEVVGLAMVGAVNEVLSDWVLRADKPALGQVIDEITELIVVMYDMLTVRRGRVPTE